MLSVCTGHTGMKPIRACVELVAVAVEGVKGGKQWDRENFEVALRRHLMLTEDSVLIHS